MTSLTTRRRAEPTAERRAQSRVARANRRDTLISLAYLSPAAAVVILLMALPLISVAADSFTDRSFISPVAEWVGLENYVELLSDSGFWFTWGRTLVWTFVSLAGQIIIGLGLALLLNRKMRGRGLFRALFLLPWVTPVVVVALIWKWMLNDLYGVINGLLGSINSAWFDLAWYSDESLALWTVIGVNIWRGVPFTMIIFLAGLQSVPRELIEASEVDGAGRWRSFVTVTLPHLKGILLTVALIFTMFNFNNFDLIYLSTRGGPADRTMTLPVQTYEVAFKGLQLGEAGAWAVLTLLTIVILAVIYFGYLRRERKQS